MLLLESEITIESLLEDLPMQRSARNLLQAQLLTLQEGLEFEFNPLRKTQAVKRYQVGDFETLPIISNRLFGTPDYWRAIAEANEMVYPYTVYPGMQLTVPEIAQHG
jgi:nucleoid-associated protein YgaU